MFVEYLMDTPEEKIKRFIVSTEVRTRDLTITNRETDSKT
jgi:hypothetical protein